MRICYADPPYPGMARKHYSGELLCAEVDHAALLEELQQYDGWGLSTGSVNLAEILPLAPEGTRVAAWVKPFASFKPNVNPGYCWEPVLFKPARKNERDRPTVQDFCVANITLRKGLAGAKPGAFVRWLRELLGYREGDQFVDLFPGTGGVRRVWMSESDAGTLPLFGSIKAQ
jgi:hypothetical protein